MHAPRNWHSVRIALARRLACELGQSLIMAIVIMGALTITTAGVVTYMTSNETSFGRDRSGDRALQVAEAGLNNTVSILSNYDSTVTVVPNTAAASLPAGGGWSAPYSLDGGTWKFKAVKTAAGRWQVTSQGTQGGVTRQLQEQVAATPGSVVTTTSPVYGYGLYVGGTSTGCTSIKGGYSVVANVFIANSLCPVGNVSLTAPTADTYTIYIGGSYQGTNNTNVGTAAVPFNHASIVGGCTIQGSAVTCSNSAASKVYAGPASHYDSIAQTPAKPTVDGAAIYAGANWNSPTCSTGSFVFDNNTTRNMSVGTFSLDTSSSYNCTVAGAGGGTLAYNKVTNVLTISGTIFVDGNLSISNSSSVVYSGSGVIYVNGTVDSKGNICGPGRTSSGNSCTGTWNTNSSAGGGVLEIVALNANGTGGPPPTSTGWNNGANGQLDVDAFVVGKYDGSGGGIVTGSIITDAADISGGGGLFVQAPPPTNAPGVTQTTNPSTWSLQPSTWQQVKAT